MPNNGEIAVKASATDSIIADMSSDGIGTQKNVDCNVLASAIDCNSNGNSPTSTDTLPPTVPLSLSNSSQTIGSMKRPSPVKCGYLFKQSSGKWKRKRWNQRWFVLDYDTGTLKYFRHASMPEAVPFRQDAHGMMLLKDSSVSLVIQSDLPRGIPTPFCFTLADGNRQFIICADSNQDFRDWTSAITVILSPRKAATDSLSSSPRSIESTEPVSNSRPSINNCATDQTPLTAKPYTTTDSVAVSKPLKNIANVQSTTDEKDPPLSTPTEAALALLLVNPLVAVIRYGNTEFLYVALIAVNSALVWLLWIRNVMLTASESDSAQDEARGDECRSSSSSSPKGRVSFDAAKKDHGLLHQLRLPTSASTEAIIPHKFQGIVNGIRAKAGASVSMCPPAPADVVVGCWCHISGSRFNVRQGM